MMSSNKTCLTVEISDIIISEGISFNISKKKFKKVLDLAINASRGYNHPNRKLISKYFLDVVHDQNTKRNLSTKNKET